MTREPTISELRDIVKQRLTRRQMQVLKLTCLGWQSKAIARQLGISPRTVDVHREKLKECLGIVPHSQRNSMIDLVSRAYFLGLFDVAPYEASDFGVPTTFHCRRDEKVQLGIDTRADAW